MDCRKIMPLPFRKCKNAFAFQDFAKDSCSWPKHSHKIVGKETTKRNRYNVRWGLAASLLSSAATQSHSSLFWCLSLAERIMMLYSALVAFVALAGSTASANNLRALSAANTCANDEDPGSRALILCNQYDQLDCDHTPTNVVCARIVMNYECATGNAPAFATGAAHTHSRGKATNLNCFLLGYLTYIFTWTSTSTHLYHCFNFSHRSQTLPC